MNSSVVALDLGGTWMKGLAASIEGSQNPVAGEIIRRQNPLNAAKSASDFANAIADFCKELTGGQVRSAIVAATAGEVNAAGNGYLCAGAHLGVMGSAPWVKMLADSLRCPVTLINDAEAFLLGAAGRNVLPTHQNVAGFVAGTGLGFAVVRNGRWWKPARRLLLFGSVETPDGDYNQLVSAVTALESGVLNSECIDTRQRYINNLTGSIATAVHLFHLDRVILGGGLIDASKQSVDIAAMVANQISGRLLPGFRPPEIIALEESNRAILEGALALAAGNKTGEPARFTKAFGQVTTERVMDGPGIESLPKEEITLRLVREESEAAMRFTDSVPQLTAGAEMLASAIRSGARVVYLGAGTSGRIGALDAVEIPCTFGMAPDRFISVIAGGSADAALTIEDQFEEDGSSVADLILLDLQPQDVVVGISASGTAFFVRSGLAFARKKGARTVLIHEADTDYHAFADLSIKLQSGPEAIGGSTRMKAGTATKKALNILSSAAMILLGKVRAGEMIDLQCTNAKLRERATRILVHCTGITTEEAAALLATNDYDLRRAIDCARPHP